MTRDDYEQTVEPLLDEARRQGRRLRLLLQFGPEFEGFTAGAVWGKTETWRHFPSLLRMIDGYAIVSDLRWMREWIHLVGFLVPFPLRVFANDHATRHSPGWSRFRRVPASPTGCCPSRA